MEHTQPTSMSFGLIWGKAWRELKAKFWLYAGVSALPAVASLAYAVAGENIGLLALGGIVLFVIQIWAGASVAYAVSNQSISLSWHDSLREGWKRLASFIWVSFLTGLIALPGILLGIIPGIIMGVWFSFGIYILMQEGDRGFRALVKSRAYVKGYAPAIFGYSLLMGIIVWVVSSAPVLALAYAGNVITAQAYSTAASIVIFPFALLFSYFLYEFCKNAKGVLTEEALAHSERQIRVWLRNCLLGLLAIAIGAIVLLTM